MISDTYAFAPGSTRITRGGSGYTGGESVSFLALTNIRITRVSAAFIYGWGTEIPGTIAVTVDGVTRFSQTFVTDSAVEKTYFPVYMDVTVTAGQTVVISGTTQVAQQNGIYWGTNSQNFYPFGMLNTTRCMDCVVDIEYELIWVIDGKNDGYPYPIGTETTKFTEFEKDEYGYPKNWGVWKLDAQNDGYPWPVGYLPAHGGGNVLVFGESGLIPASVLVFGESGLLPAQIVTYT